MDLPSAKLLPPRMNSNQVFFYEEEEEENIPGVEEQLVRSGHPWEEVV